MNSKDQKPPPELRRARKYSPLQILLFGGIMALLI
jgi:hypothetical protein